MTDPEKRVRDLVSELDSIIPNKNAKVRIDVYGGGIDESYLRGNRRGLQRLGVKLLKAADAPFKDSSSKFDPETVDTDVSNLFHEETDIRLDSIERTDDLASETHLITEVRRQRRTGWIWTIVAVIVISLVLFLIKTIKGML
ncbi:hypothetical protein ACFLQL_01870 [Verrucomicrobiota bacterium]